MREFPRFGRAPVGLDLVSSEFTQVVGSICDRAKLQEAMAGVEAVLHTATLHKPHVATHAKQDFVDVNVTGTLTLLQAAVDLGVPRFIFASTTSAFGTALRPQVGDPAAVVAAIYPEFDSVYAAAGYRMFADISPVYVNDRAMAQLGWRPHYDFGQVLRQIAAGQPIGSDLARLVGAKGYHGSAQADGLYRVS